jgi:hypothetical protein
MPARSLLRCNDVTGWRVVSKGRVMVLNFIDHERVASQQVNGFGRSDRPRGKAGAWTRELRYEGR